MAYYNSPRWSGEICDCSMPMTFDTYSACSYNCLYCFAYFQKSHTVNGYKGVENVKARNVNPVNVERVKKIFTDKNSQFYPYIKNRITMQWGGMADGFDDNEDQQQKSLELLKFFDEIDYPLSISTKGVNFTKDKEYMDIIRKHKHNWHFKISIISNDEDKCRIIEEYCPSPTERFKAMKRLSKAGVSTTLRLRPYIIGLSDDYPYLIRKAAKCGAKSVTTEFFCLEARATQELLDKYKRMSRVLGYDIYEFYRKHSHGAGYRRLNYNLKKPIIENMKKLTHKNKMLFYVSDAHHKEKCDTVCCCGTPPDFKVYHGHFAEALQIARKSKDHTVRWSDLKPEAKTILNGFLWERANGFQTNSSQDRARHRYQTMYDYLREVWNTPKKGKSPYKYFEGVLYPVGLDDCNDVIYKMNMKKAKTRR